MATKPVTNSVRVEIYDQIYNLRGSDPEYIETLAKFVDEKMRSVAGQTQTIDSLRLAVLGALNIADEYHVLRRKYDALSSQSKERVSRLAGELDEILEDTPRRVG